MSTNISFWPIFSIVLALTNAAANNFDLHRILGGYRPGNHTLAKHYVVVISLKIGQICGGSIISSNTVLTAAHCVANGTKAWKPEDIIVISGRTKRMIVENREQILKVANIRIHEGYQIGRLKMINDIAVLLLESDIIEDGINAERIPLARGKTAADTVCTLFGLGKFIPGGPLAAELTYVDLPILSNKKCRKIISSVKWRFLNFLTAVQIRRTTICVIDLIDKSSFKSGCQGDSGGPMICNGVLVGVASFAEGPNCGDGISVYTNVYRFLDWIENRANISLGVDAKLLVSMAVALVVMVVHY